MPRPISGVRSGIVVLALAALLGACSDEKTSPTSPAADALRPSFALSLTSSNFQQCGNGDDGGEPCFYINGVLNDSKSLYRESDVIAERFVLPDVTPGHTYRLVFDYGWEKAVNPGHMNYDFVAGWNTTLGVLANPCGDPLGNNASDIRDVCDGNIVRATHTGANAAFQVIPDPIFTTNAPLGLSTELQAAIDRFQTTNGATAVRFDILGGSFPAGAFDNVTYTVSGDNVTARFTVRFIPNQTSVMLLWGGHFADSRDYRFALWDDDKTAATPEVTGNLTGAAGQSGAPFHFTQQYIKNLSSGDSTGIGSLSNNVQGNVLEPLPRANISIAADATNGIGESHTFTVTVKKDLDDGAGEIPAAGEHVDVTLGGAGGASAVIDEAASTCDNAGANTDANGQCIIVFSSNTAGTITGTATVTLTINGSPLTVSTDGSGDNSAPAVKTFVAGTIRWLKHDFAGQLLGGAVFEVCRTHLWDSDANNGAGAQIDITTDVCFDVTDNVSGTDNTNAPPADRDGTGGEFELGGLILGTYTVKEKTAPPGYILDPDTETAALSTTTTSVTITTAFVNIAPDAFITIGPATATNSVGDPHTFTAVMTAIPNGGSPVSIPDFTISVLPPPSTPGSTSCAAFDAATNSKTCTRTINSNVVGTFTANASATTTIGSVTLTRDTDPATANIGAGPGGSGPAVKTYVAPLLSITKTPDLATDVGGTVHPGEIASFTITVSNAAAATTSAKGVSMTDTLPAGLTWTSNQAGTCTIGQVTVQEGNPPGPVSHDRIICAIPDLAPGASFAVTVSATIPAGFIQIPPSPDGDAIEIDGNLLNGGADGSDWASLHGTAIFNCLSNPRIGCSLDLVNSRDDNAFGQGAKEDTPFPTVVSGSIPNNKSDLRRFYVASERFGTTDFLYFAWSRVQEPNGTTNMDIELNQSAVVPTVQQGGNGVTPVRTPGDILVRYNLAQGGDKPELAFHRWLTSGPSSACEASNSVPCWSDSLPLSPTAVNAAINTQAEPEPVEGITLSDHTFGEAAINLQASGIFEPGVCRVFGMAFLKSRSSDAFTAELKDFVTPIPINITNCRPVTLNNKAWAEADNFAPTGGNLGDSIFDTGKIEVTENGTASLNIAPTGRELALVSLGGEPTFGIAATMDEIDASVRREAQGRSDFEADFAERSGAASSRSSRARPIAADDGVGTPPRTTARGREMTSRSATTALPSSPMVARRSL
jgi:uncharacterized repeat protein (TIGR01451 family)